MVSKQKSSQSTSVSSTNSNSTLQTDKLYQTVSDGRMLETSHTVRGYNGSGDYRNDSYSGEFEF